MIKIYNELFNDPASFFAPVNIAAPVDPMDWVALFNIVSEKTKGASTESRFHLRDHILALIEGLRTLINAFGLVADASSPPTQPDLALPLETLTPGDAITLDQLNELEGAIEFKDILSSDTIALVQHVVMVGLTHLQRRTQKILRSYLVL